MLNAKRFVLLCCFSLQPTDEKKMCQTVLFTVYFKVEQYLHVLFLFQSCQSFANFIYRIEAQYNCWHQMVFLCSCLQVLISICLHFTNNEGSLSHSVLLCALQSIMSSVGKGTITISKCEDCNFVIYSGMTRKPLFLT